MLMEFALITGLSGIALSFTRYHLSPAVPILCIASLILTLAA